MLATEIEDIGVREYTGHRSMLRTDIQPFTQSLSQTYASIFDYAYCLLTT